MASKTLNLFGGYRIPIVGFGTYTAINEEELEKALDVALETGYRHIDTAALYNNEHVIGKTLKKWFDSGKLKREDIFITTKLPGCQPPDKVEGLLKESLEKLQLDYVDLYLIHFPLHLKRHPFDSTAPASQTETEPTDHVATWKKMEEQVDLGRTKTIGISNFNINQTKRILDNARIKPATNQVELNVYLQQPELVKFCQENGVVIVSHQSLGNPGANKWFKSLNMPLRNLHDLLNDPTIKKIAQKHNKASSQVLLKYLVQKDIVVIPKSVTPSRIRENFNLFDFTLDSADMKELEGLDQGEDARASLMNFSEAMVNDPEYPYPKRPVASVY